jgi:hypothetical protein
MKNIRASNRKLLDALVKVKVYELIARKKDLPPAQTEKQQWAQIYFSKKFEKWYVTNWGQPAYDKYIQSMLTKYPDFKQ